MDVGHPEYYRDVVAKALADHHGVSYAAIAGLCYSQVRGRYATHKRPERISDRQARLYKKRGLRVPDGDTIYVGEDLTKLSQVAELLEERFPGVPIKYDDHHRRQEADVAQFLAIVQGQ